MILFYLGLALLLLLVFGFAVRPLVCVSQGSSLSTHPPLFSKKTRVCLAAGLCFLITGMAGLGYVLWGHGSQYHSFLIRTQAEKLLQDPNHVIAVLKKRVSETPNDETAWFLLGQMYFSTEKLAEALFAFKKAHELAPDELRMKIRYAEALYFSHKEQLTDAVDQLFQEVLQVDPNNAEIINLLAMDAYQKNKYQTAKRYWQQLLILYPQDSADHQLLQQAIQKAESAEWRASQR